MRAKHHEIKITVMVDLDHDDVTDLGHDEQVARAIKIATDYLSAEGLKLLYDEAEDYRFVNYDRIAITFDAY